MKRFVKIFLLLCGVLFISCRSAPVPVNAPPEETAPAPVLVEEAPLQIEEKPEEEAFDPASISQEEYDTVKVDIQALINNLNQIIRRKDYNAWASNLGKAYFDRISSPEFLTRTSESSQRLKNQNIVLKNAREYYLEVVVPSRANDRVDDIVFVTHTRVKAYTINAKKERLRLYDLENSGDGWKIVN
jgi:hypothetical protein